MKSVSKRSDIMANQTDFVAVALATPNNTLDNTVKPPVINGHFFIR